MPYKFCPECGGRLQKAKENLLICKQCAYEFWINPRPCNMVIVINNKNEILLVKRKFAPSKGLWDLPGGFMELHENSEQAAIRELKEETHLNVSQIKYLGSTTGIYKYQGNKLTTIAMAYVAQVKNFNVKVGDDAKDFYWFNIKKIPMDQLAFKCIKWAINKWQYSK
jgi:NADH pyrophosphatase NudC (nudix superfamily)